ncbi:MAG: hypothetical protein KAI81_04325 [Candidatus Marinimicrobia bacterium]|nr:hypothetical protein [Candidatus Neomarinimicrobiota bacterium]
MAIPIIAGGAILGFMTWGEDIFGKTTFKKILTGGIIVLIIGIGYVGYKMYEAAKKAKEKVDDTYEAAGDIIEGGWQWILEAGERGNQLIEEVDQWADESKEARQEAVDYLNPYLGIKSGITESSFEAKSYEAGQKIRNDILNTPAWIKEKLKFW